MSLEFRVISDSMSPIIKVGDLLQIAENKSDFELFDIILFKRKETLFVHFVWRNQIAFNNTIITRSLKDFLNDEEPIESKDIVGLVTNFQFNFIWRTKILLTAFLRGRL